MVPKGWQRRTLEQITVEKISYGIVQAGPHCDNGVPYLKSSDVGSDIDVASLQKTEPEIHYQYRRSAVRPGHIVFSLRGNLGATSIVPDGLSEANLTQGTARIAVDSSNDVYFVRYQLANDFTMHLIERVSKGSTFKEISLESLRKIPVTLPPLPEQRKIAQILSTWDKAIATTERLLANKEQQKKALMQRLLTGKQRFAGFEGEWQNLTLAEVAQITMGSSPLSTAYNDSGDGLPLIQGNADIKDRLSAPRIHTSQITKECFSDDVLLSVRAPVGTVAKSRHHACIGRGIAAIRAKGLLSQEYLYQLLLDFEPKWERLSQGSTFESVNSDDIKSMPVRLPCIKEQQKIASVLLATDTEITTIQSQLDNLKLQKKALMQQLLTGKRRVKVDEAAA